jgi:hypothetical protein
VEGEGNGRRTRRIKDFMGKQKIWDLLPIDLPYKKY